LPFPSFIFVKTIGERSLKGLPLLGFSHGPQSLALDRHRFTQWRVRHRFENAFIPSQKLPSRLLQQ